LLSVTWTASVRNPEKADVAFQKIRKLPQSSRFSPLGTTASEGKPQAMDLPPSILAVRSRLPPRSFPSPPPGKSSLADLPAFLPFSRIATPRSDAWDHGSPEVKLTTCSRIKSQALFLCPRPLLRGSCRLLRGAPPGPSSLFCARLPPTVTPLCSLYALFFKKSSFPFFFRKWMFPLRLGSVSLP